MNCLFLVSPVDKPWEMIQVYGSNHFKFETSFLLWDSQSECFHWEPADNYKPYSAREAMEHEAQRNREVRAPAPLA